MCVWPTTTTCSSTPARARDHTGSGLSTSTNSSSRRGVAWQNSTGPSPSTSRLTVSGSPTRSARCRGCSNDAAARADSPFGPGAASPSYAATISRSQLPCTQTARSPSDASRSSDSPGIGPSAMSPSSTTRSAAATSGSASTASRAGRLPWMSARTATRTSRSCLTTLDRMAALTVGYAAMLEQFPPREAVELTAFAEQHGFSGCMAADHFQPWVPAQGQSSFVWNVLTAVGERTTGDLGPGVTCPSFRFHPAVVAQASATLAAMYPGRHWLGVGAGEALNEHVIGGYWPEAAERSTRMFEAIEVIKKLFDSSVAGKDVKHQGRFFTLETTRLWTMPATPPPVLVATAGPVNAKRTGKHADGIITVGAPLEKIGGLFDKFAEGAREAGKDPDSMHRVLQLHLSWAETDEQALANAMDQWPNGGTKFPKADIRSPVDFEQLAKLGRPGGFEGRMLITSAPDAHRAYIQRFVDLGFDRVYLHNVGRNRAEWSQVFRLERPPQPAR